MGAAGILTRDEVTAEGKPLESERWAGAVDAVGGGDAAVRAADAADRRRGRGVAATPAGPKLETTVFPFILRGVALLGMDSVNMPIAPAARPVGPAGDGPAAARPRRPLRREVTLDTLDDGARRRSSPGGARGRWIVRIGD